jgi:hypothetical protein
MFRIFSFVSDEAMAGIEALTSRINLDNPDQCDVITSHPQFKWALYISDILTAAIKAFLKKIGMKFPNYHLPQLYQTAGNNP